IAWLQTDPNWPIISFNASLISHAPSSTLAELTAVLAAIFVAPNNTR
ncbi:10779_t:CDS:1, partial [Funneliformis geosporum]